MNLEDAIEQALVEVEDGKVDPARYFRELATEAPEIFAFFFDQDTRLLLEREHDYLLFIGMIILEALRLHERGPGLTDLEELARTADHNWGLLEFASISSLTSSLEGYAAMPLYVFLEESCSPEDSHEILSEVAVEIVYVKCKTIIDLSFRVKAQ